jgi:hypothetical protein
MGFYLGCFVIFILLIMISIVTTRRKSKVILDEVKDPQDNALDDPDKFDLYESIYDFMTKQNQYIQSIG